MSSYHYRTVALPLTVAIRCFTELVGRYASRHPLVGGYHYGGRFVSDDEIQELNNAVYNRIRNYTARCLNEVDTSDLSWMKRWKEALTRAYRKYVYGLRWSFRLEDSEDSTALVYSGVIVVPVDPEYFESQNLSFAIVIADGQCHLELISKDGNLPYFPAYSSLWEGILWLPTESAKKGIAYSKLEGYRKPPNS